MSAVSKDGPRTPRPNTPSRSRDSISPEFCKFVCASSNRGRREDRVRAAPAVSCAVGSKKNAHERTGEAEAVRPSLRNGFNAYAALSLVSGFCHHRPREALAPRELDACSRGARTTRLRRTLQAARPRAFAPEAAASTASRTNVSWTVMIRPSQGHGTAGIIQVICGWNQGIFRKSEYDEMERKERPRSGAAKTRQYQTNFITRRTYASNQHLQRFHQERRPVVKSL